MFPLFKWIMNQLIDKRLSIILLIIHPQIKTFNTLIQRKKRFLPSLVGSDNHHLMPLLHQPISLVGKHSLHSSGIICSCYVIDYFHDWRAIDLLYSSLSSLGMQSNNAKITKQSVETLSHTIKCTNNNNNIIVLYSLKRSIAKYAALHIKTLKARRPVNPI